jgi:diadenosine tetraphosphatase ApaH/serine/threonine PP2A family protein phosphatase
MRYLVLTDIHGNLDALDAVLAAAGPVDDRLVLGDIVGYGAEPNAVIDRIRSIEPRIIIRGNHDKVAAGIELPESFNPAALRAARWTSAALTAANREWLERLPAGPVIVDDLVEICHGSPDDEDEYLFSATDARLAFAATRRPVCLFGHTHVPACYSVADDDLDEVRIGETCAFDDGDHGIEVAFEPGCRYLINPGAVGQPRDGDARAAYAIYDSVRQTISLARVPYPVALAQARILAAGLPDVLARRLGLGR